jgi:hypothetical protein
MFLRSLLLLLLLTMVLPTATAQISIAHHNITYELREGEALVEETLLFVNPETSDVHTFNKNIVLSRGNTGNLSIMGVPSRTSNKTLPTTISLDFSRDPIYRSASVNKRIVLLRYLTRDFSREELLDGAKKIYVFSGNVLQHLPRELPVGETNILISLREDFQIILLLPPTDVRGNELLYFMSEEDRKVYTSFYAEVQYGKFKETAITDIEIVKRRLADSKSKVEDAQSAIQNALIYEANTTNALDSLNTSIGLINQSQELLELAEILLEEEDYFSAYIFTNSSAYFVERAIKAASMAEKEANTELRITLNKKISRLENMTANITPFLSMQPAEEEVVLEPEMPPPETTAAPAPQEEEVEVVLEAEKSSKNILAVIILFSLAFLVFVISRGKKTKRRHSDVKDFRAISDLKRRSYKGFEEKVVDVKKETTIAGEIRRLEKERKKYELGVDNLKKKKLAGEISEKNFNAEKKKFQAHIADLNKRLEELESKLPKKGGWDGKSSTDRPK